MAHVFVKGLGIRYELPDDEKEKHYHEYKTNEDGTTTCSCGAEL